MAAQSCKHENALWVDYNVWFGDNGIWAAVFLSYNAKPNIVMKANTFNTRDAATQPADVLAEKAHELLTNPKIAIAVLTLMGAIVIIYQCGSISKTITLITAIFSTIWLCLFATIDIKEGGVS